MRPFSQRDLQPKYGAPATFRYMPVYRLFCKDFVYSMIKGGRPVLHVLYQIEAYK
jgi:hypothetical protein